MDLKTKLSMLSGESDFEGDLAGVSTTPRESENIEADENNESKIDFNLGTLSIDSYLNLNKTENKKSKKSSKKDTKKTRDFDDFFSDFDDDEVGDIGKYRTGNHDLDLATARSKKLLLQADLLSADKFDTFLDDDGYDIEENLEMKDGLVAMGRKYARDSAASKESSEISKTFADAETKLKQLYEEVGRDKANIDKDIERMRIPGRGGKILADMVSAKNSYNSTQLAIVKELNTMKKTIFELRAKEAARKEAQAAGSSDISSNTLQSIFSTSRSEMMKGMGGYTGVSGAIDDDSDSTIIRDDVDEEDDEVIQKKYFANTSESESDGDKWLKYENRGVGYILIIDNNDNPQTILAEDRDGNIIYDYPIPNIDELIFDLDKIGMRASDNLHRNYTLRIEDDR